MAPRDAKSARSRRNSTIQSSRGARALEIKSPVTTARSAPGVPQVDGTPDRRAGHEVPDVDIAELSDAETIQPGGDMRHGDVDGDEAIATPSRCAAICRRQEGQAAREPGRIAKDGTTRWFDTRPLRHGQGRHGGSREPLEAPHRRYPQKSQTRRDQPEPGPRSPPWPEHSPRKITGP